MPSAVTVPVVPHQPSSLSLGGFARMHLGTPGPVRTIDQRRSFRLDAIVSGDVKETLVSDEPDCRLVDEGSGLRRLAQRPDRY